jgi:serine/threonine protein kinase
MGVLYRVSDEARDGQVVALKTVTAETPESLARFQRELRVLTQLHHPNLVNIFDYGTLTEDELYFTMEWVEGQNLEPSLHPLEPAATIL